MREDGKDFLGGFEANMSKILGIGCDNKAKSIPPAVCWLETARGIIFTLGLSNPISKAVLSERR